MGLFDLFSGPDSQSASPLDALFSPSPQMQDQARAQSLMQMGAAMLQASGPSRMPVGLGQVLGAGMQGGMQGYNGALQNQIRNQAMAGELAKNKMGIMQGLAGQAAMARAFGQQAPDYIGMLTGQPSAPAAPSGSAATTASPAPDASMGAPAAGTWDSAPSPMAGANFAPVSGLMSSTAADPSQAQASAAQDASQPLLRLPPGMNGATAYALSMNPATAPIIQKAIENQYPGPSNILQLQQEAASLPDGPVRQALLGQVDKLNYIAPASARPGGYSQDPHTGKWTWMPAVPAGAMPKFDSQGNFTGVTPIPGATAVAQQQATASAYGSGVGKAATTPQSVTLPNGAPGVTTVGNALGLPSPAGTGGGAPGGAGNPGGRAQAVAPAQTARQYPWPSGNANSYNILPGQTGLAPGQQQQAESQAKNSEKLRQDNTLSAQAAQQSNYKLDRMEAAMQHFTPGPSASWKGNLAQTLSKYGLASDDVQKYLGAMTEYNKYGTQLGGDLANQSKAGNAVTVFETMQKANPNVLTPADAAHNIIASNRALNDYTIARSKMQNAWADSHQGSVNGFNDWYTNNVNPNAFLLPKMNQAERQNFFRSLPKPQLQQLMKDYQSVQTWKQQGLL